jgi:cytochrome c oxidase subunit IV
MQRFLAWYAVTSSVAAVVALVVANAIPLIGVLFFGWSVWTILIVYWLENGIVGGFNVLKMARAQGGDDSAATSWSLNGRPAASMAKAGLIPFFIIHYGVFWVVHGVFVFTLPLFVSIGANGSDIGQAPDIWTILFAVAALFVSHGLSYLFNYIGNGEYLRTSPIVQMFAPYGRLVVLHVTIIFGAIAISMTGAPVAAIVILVVLKTAMDLGLHLHEHRRLAGPAVVNLSTG